MMKTTHIAWLSFASLVLMCTSQQPQLAAAECAGQVIPSPNTGNGESVLTSVAAVSATEMWSVGQSFPTEDGHQALIEHWEGAAWTVVPGPTLSTPHQLSAAAAAASDDVWAVGSFTPGARGVIEHWDGASWTPVPHPDPSVISPFLGVAVVASPDVWAVGYYFNETMYQYQTLIEHWDGTSWSIVPSPNQPGSNTLHAVAAHTANDVWAVGEYRGIGLNGMLIEHWDGASWSLMSIPSLDGTYGVLQSVVARAADDVWAVGRTGRSSEHGQMTLTVHWDGASWNMVPSPNDGTADNELSGVTALNTADVWAVGTAGGLARSRALVEHWDGASWSIVASPNVGTASLFGGIVAFSANDVWAVGTNGDSLIEHWNGAAWSVVESPNVGTAWNLLKGVAILSADDAWAVGAITQPRYSRTLAQHWDGTTWSIVPTPNARGDNQLTSVAAIATNDVWAVGYLYDDAGVVRALIMHWDGTSWTIIPGPNLSGPTALLGVAAVSANDVWAVGGSGSPPPYSNRSLILHWDGTLWNEVPLPDQARSALFGLSVLSGDDIWAVGGAVGQSALILHWDGATWTRMPGPNVNANYFDLNAVSSISSNDIWAVGVSVVIYFDGEYEQDVYSTLTVHWDGTRWSVVPSPNEPYSNSLIGIAAVNTNDVWAIGQYNGYEGFLEHWDGGRWTLISAVEPPNDPELKGVAAVPGGGSVWAVGAYPQPTVGLQTLIQTYGCQAR